MDSLEMENDAPVKKQEVFCPVCDSKDYQVKYEPWVDVEDPIRLYGAASGIQGTQRLVICQDCGILYENPCYPESVILSGYASSDDAGHDSQHRMRVDSFYGALKSLKKLLPKSGANVLDVGTAGGAFLEAANRFGYNAIGLEPSKFLTEQGQARGLNIVQGTMRHHDLKKGSFELVCLWDVLEHIASPKDALLQIKPLLKPGGVLLINYPDIGTWQAKLAGKRFWWLLSVHLQHFSRNSIRKICELTGYEVVGFKPYWQTLEFGYLESMAVHFNVPGSKLLERITPEVIKKIPVPYYASQTTAIVKVKI